MTPIPVEQALTLLLQAIHPIEAVERLPLGLACGRISAHTVLARLPQPPFNRSAMDGYVFVEEHLFIQCSVDALPAFRGNVQFKRRGGSR